MNPPGKSTQPVENDNSTCFLTLPQVPVIDEADLPLGVLVHSKPKLLLPPEEVNPEGAEAPEDSQPG